MRFFILFILFICYSYFTEAQISVTVKDKRNLQPIQAVSVISLNQQKITESDHNGKFQIASHYDSLFLAHWNYQTILVNLNHDTTIYLISKVDTLEMVAVEGKILEEEKAIQFSRSEIVDLSPSFLSSFNLERNLQVLPGVTVTNDTQSGLYVRGGHRGESRILFNNIPQYSSNHLFGLASNYQEDLLRKVSFHKGYFPSAMYNGVTSFLTVDVDQEIPQKSALKLALGTLSSEAYAKIRVNEKTKVDLGYRRAYLDWLGSYYNAIKKEDLIPIYGFDDFSVNIVRKMDTNDKFNVTYILSHDNIKSSLNNNAIKSDWSGQTLSMNYLKLSNIGVWEFYSGFNSNQFNFIHSSTSETDTTLARNNLNSYVLGIKLFQDINPKLKLESTIEYQQVRGDVNNDWISTSSVDRTLKNDISQIHQQNISSHLYYQINRFLAINGGVNVNYYIRQNFRDLQLAPRLSLNFEIRHHSVNFSYNRSFQNIHYLPYIGFDMPIDMWEWTNETLSPLLSDNFQVDYKVKILGELALNIGLFYNDKRNVIDYKDGSDYLYNPWDHEQITQGVEHIRGAEFEIKSTFLNTPIRASYTYLESERSSDEIHNGNPYPNSYSPQHQITLALHKKINKRLSLNCNWYYSTGQRITIPESFILSTPSNEHTSFVVPVYDQRNNFELPPSHRMDVSMNYFIPIRSNQLQLTLSIFNIYNNKNAYFVSFEKVERNDEPSLIQGHKKALIPFLPSFKITYQL
ncbi:TonB-dependent siderophore receptor [Flammeovirga sp. OC4]|uniref:TonB-dependent receptor plug domain-containing protein n=1 Tax=Flammeovirga sp. OC4 TaxID=1382345 RepID=UPI0005C4C090|nr:TonB-dependent receptor [Flammeovirga sp. OC4]